MNVLVMAVRLRERLNIEWSNPELVGIVTKDR